MGIIQLNSSATLTISNVYECKLVPPLIVHFHLMVDVTMSFFQLLLTFALVLSLLVAVTIVDDDNAFWRVLADDFAQSIGCSLQEMAPISLCEADQGNDLQSQVSFQPSIKLMKLERKWISRISLSVLCVSANWRAEIRWRFCAVSTSSTARVLIPGWSTSALFARFADREFIMWRTG